MLKLCLSVDDVAHVTDALMDMIADESYHLPTEANHACLAMLAELKSPSVDNTYDICSWLISNVEKFVDQSSSQETLCLNRENYGWSFINFRFQSSSKKNGDPTCNSWGCQIRSSFFKVVPAYFMITGLNFLLKTPLK